MVGVLDNPSGRRQIHEGLFTWDGTYYRVLADVWYGGAHQDAARFFPVYPGVAKILGPLFGGRTDWALLLISNCCAFLAAWVLWRLVAEVVDRPTADRSAWMVALFPAAFVLAFAYSEGAALLLVAATFLALKRERFVIAGLLALVAAALRPVGGLLMVPIAIELWITRPRIKIGEWIIGLAAPILGLFASLFLIERSTGDFWLPVRLQGTIRGGFQDPVSRVLEPIGELAKGNFRDTYNLGFMLVLLFLSYQMIKKRQPASWIAYSAVSLLLLLSSQVTDSLGRYGLVVIPFVVAMAQWAKERRRQALVAVGCTGGLIWLTSEALLGRLVP